ncbi:tigger transposable element-derived protein 4-like [Parasteatoda tepidariorum]|uniref:tigger transposable element-derived protein 4-like n=1 Tax=Parasteatoda tepidariorum TaxID=114398 RepID=UPI0039BCF7FE
MANSKRKTLSIDDKMGIIRKIENGCNQADISRKSKLPKSAVCNVWKNGQLIISAHEKNLDGRKKLRKADHKDVEEALLKWFSIRRSRNHPVSEQNVDEFAKRFCETTFMCSNDRLDMFNKRNYRNSGKIIRESGSVSKSDVEDCSSAKDYEFFFVRKMRSNKN